MINEVELINNIDELIGDIKKCIHDAGITGDSSEFQIVTELFLYKFLNDKFKYEIKKIEPKKFNNDNFSNTLEKLSEKEYQLLIKRLGTKSARLEKNQTISFLFNNRNFSENGHDFAWLLDDTLVQISNMNLDIFSVKTSSGDLIKLFDGVCYNIANSKKKNDFAVSVITKLAQSYNFEQVFEEKFDFYSIIFEHLISDYNSNGGAEYAEYYTPRTIAQVIAKILVRDKVKNVTVHDPTAGSGTLLMGISHEIGEDNCTIYSQDLTQKSVKLLRLNLILNGLTHSLNNVHQGNILNDVACKTEDSRSLQTFDYVVSNPPFKVDYSDQFDDCSSDKSSRIDNEKILKRFFAGVPKISNDPKKSPIYLLVLQHILYVLKENGKAGIVVPTKFLDWTSNIAKDIRRYLIDNHYLKAVIQMPPNVFANTGTKVSILFIDKSNDNNKVFLFDATEYGEQISIKHGGKKLTKTILSEKDIEEIVNIVNNKIVKKDLSVLEDCESIIANDYSLVAGMYFGFEIEYEKLTNKEFKEKIELLNNELSEIFKNSNILQKKILKQKDNFVKK